MIAFVKHILVLYRASYSELPRDVWILSFVMFINRSGSMVLFFLTLYLTTQLNFSISEAGRMISLYGLGSLIGAFIGGWLSDHWGTSRIIIWSLILSGVGYIVLGQLQTPSLIAITIFFLAAVAEAFRPANSTAVGTACPPRIRARGYALSRLAANLGFAIGPAVGGYLALINYGYLFWVDGITCFGAALLFWIFIRKFKSKPVPELIDERTSDLPPWRDKIYLMILGLMLIFGIIFVQIFNTWPIYLKEIYQLNESNIGMLLALNAILIVLIEMPLVHKLENKNPLRMMSIGSLLLMAGFSLLPFGRAYLFVAFTVIIWTFGEMLVFPLVTGFISNRATDANRGKYMGMSTFTFALAFVIGPSLGTWIYEVFGGTFLWITVGIFGFICWAGFRYINMLNK